MAGANAELVERAKLAWQRSPVRGFLRWWGGELAAMLPPRLRDFVRRGPDILWLSVQGGVAVVRRARSGAVLARISSELPEQAQRVAFADACQGIDSHDRRLWLLVPATQVLARRLVMPSAATADARRVVGYEIDRQTPFKSDQVYYDVRVGEGPVPAGHVVLDLFVTPKAALVPLLERFAAMGAHPDAAGVEMDGRVLSDIDLLPPGSRPRHPDRRRRVNGILAVVGVLLAVAVLSQWLDNRRAALVRMQGEVAAMRARAAQSEQLRAQLTGAIAASKFLVKRKAQTPSALAVLDDLTRRLPDSTWLDALTLDDEGGLDVKGEAAKAAALIETLGDSGIVAEPRLQGVIRPDPATGKERFELVAHVRRQGSSDAR